MIIIYVFFYFIILSHAVGARSNVTFLSFTPEASLILIFLPLLLAIFVDEFDVIRLVRLYILLKTHPIVV